MAQESSDEGLIDARDLVAIGMSPARPVTRLLAPPASSVSSSVRQLCASHDQALARGNQAPLTKYHPDARLAVSGRHLHHERLDLRAYRDSVSAPRPEHAAGGRGERTRHLTRQPGQRPSHRRVRVGRSFQKCRSVPVHRPAVDRLGGSQLAGARSIGPTGAKRTHRVLPMQVTHRNEFCQDTLRLLAAYRAVSAPTNSARVAIPIRPIFAPQARFSGASYVRQQVSLREHFRRGNARGTTIGQ